MLSPKKREGRRSVAIFLLATCTVVCSSIHGSRLPTDLFPTASAFASGNRAAKKGFFLNRSLVKKFSPLFSAEPNSVPGSPLPTPTTANSINGDASSVVGDNSEAAPLLDKVRMVSNFASFLCVLDCTLLPLITVALPLLGVLNLGAGQLEAIDNLGHSLALFFVLPVGSLTTIVNYLSHKKKWISALALVGLAMVGLANSHTHVHHWPTLLLPATGITFSLDWIGTVLHKIQGCGTSPWHRIVNVSGCAFLLGSNFLSQRQDGCAAHAIAGGGGADCGHDHDHKQDHGSSCDH